MLDAEQIAALHAIISKAYIDRDIADEMLDHYASHIESLMISGHPFTKALNMALQTLPTETLSEINKAYKKTKLMKNIKTATPIALGLTLFAIVLNINLLSQEESYQLPIAQEDMIRVASGFGMRDHPLTKAKKMHTGIDYIAPLGTPVKTVKSGTVVSAEMLEKGMGHHIIIQHADSTQSLYAHLDKIYVKKGEIISANTIIGTVGNTGSSTGPHLHFEVIQKGLKVNPLKLDSVFSKWD